jgi:hypothetical protein
MDSMQFNLYISFSIKGQFHESFAQVIVQQKMMILIILVGTISHFYSFFSLIVKFLFGDL